MNKNGRIEILAPVGGQEQLIAAVRSGADAVYFGLQDFNARRNAENFAGDGLADTVAYCHLHGVKVYITLNTLIKDEELAAMKRAADTAAEAGVDALIVQDLAVAAYVRDTWKDLPLFASTQMVCVDEEGVSLLMEHGYSRVVLGRELSLKEIRSIIKNTGVKAEVFVHGAHCMSVSGACYMSSLIGARSGNRGLCAQPCRLDWRIGSKDHALSLKDLSYVEHLKELEDAGVSSVKIEGRMKRAEYVAASVTACRDALEGRKPDMETLRAVFSRSGFTDGYLMGKRGPQMFGYRTKEDVTAASGVLGELAKIYEKEPQSVPVDMVLSVHEGRPSELSVFGAGYFASAEGAAPERARTLPLDEEYARKSLSKTGGSMYFLDGLTLDAEPGLMLPASALNALRREALAGLDAAIVSSSTPVYERSGADEPKMRAEDAAPAGTDEAAVRPASVGGSSYPEGFADAGAKLSHLFSGGKKYICRFEDGGQLFAPAEDEIIMLPLRALEKDPGIIERCAGRLICELPAVIWPEEAPRAEERLRSLIQKGLTDAWADNIGGLRLARRLGLRVHGGSGLNILNSEALAQAEGFGLSSVCASFELSMAGIGRLRHEKPMGYISYGRLPLMKFRACPMRGEKGCGDCSGLNFITDRTETDFPLICRERSYSELLNSVPLYIADKERADADYELLYFTIESPSECRLIRSMLRSGESPDFRRTGGLYYRKLL